MAIDLGPAFVKGLYSKNKAQKVAAPLPPSDNMPWGPAPQLNPAFIDPRTAPNTAGFPPPQGAGLGPSLRSNEPPERPMMPMQQPPIMGPQQPQAIGSGRPTRATIRPGTRRPTSGLPAGQRASPTEPAGEQMLRMMQGEPRGR